MDEYFVEEKSNWDRFLDFLVFISVLAVTIFLILEILGLSGKTGIDVVDLNGIYFWVNIGVFAVFVLDLIRLWKHAEGFKDFMSRNWLDVLATIPFELIAFALGGIDPQRAAQLGVLKWFRVTKLTGVSKLQKVSRISKISKEFKAASHLKKESEEYKKKHRL